MALAQVNYLQKAHRLSFYDVAETVTTINAGQLFQLNDEGEWEYADGTRKAYPTLNNRYAGIGLGAQGERLEGRDDVSRTGKIACLAGNFEIGTDQYDDTETYLPGKALFPGDDGKVRLFVSGTDEAAFIVGFVTRAPEDDEDFLVYQG